MQTKVTKAIFPVAGMGTRFLPATKSVPKEIMTLVDRPLVQYAIDEARAAGIEEFIFVTAKGMGGHVGVRFTPVAQRKASAYQRIRCVVPCCGSRQVRQALWDTCAR